MDIGSFGSCVISACLGEGEERGGSGRAAGGWDGWPLFVGPDPVKSGDIKFVTDHSCMQVFRLTPLSMPDEQMNANRAESY